MNDSVFWSSQSVDILVMGYAQSKSQESLTSGLASSRVWKPGMYGTVGGIEQLRDEPT